MSQNGIIGLLLIGLLFGGVVMLSRRRVTQAAPATIQQGNVSLVPTRGPMHYTNEETRTITWNEEGLPIEIKIKRDYTIV